MPIVSKLPFVRQWGQLPDCKQVFLVSVAAVVGALLVYLLFVVVSVRWGNEALLVCGSAWSAVIITGLVAVAVSCYQEYRKGES